MKNVLIIREGSLGDLILTLPVIQSLKKNNFYVYLAGKGIYKNFFEIYSNIDGFYSFDNTFFLPLFSGEENKLLSEFLNNFDLIIFYEDEKTLQGKTIRKIFKGEILFHPVKNEHLKMHIIDYLLLPVRNFSIEIEKHPFLRIKNEEENIIVIHPGSGSSHKNYKKENFLGIIKKIKEREFKVILGPAEFDQFQWWTNKIGQEKILKTSFLQDIVDIVKTTKIYIGNDSGITHLFASCGVKTIAIFGPTSPFIWGPRGKKVKIIFKEVGCNPCSKEKMKNCKEKLCFEQIEIKDIINFIEKF